MTTDATSLDLADLRKANLTRLPLFTNARGEPAHAQPDGSDWSLTDWYTAMAGEAGELGNLIKKIRRGDFGNDPDPATMDRVASEMADVLIYLDILAFRSGIDLAAAVIATFNAKSEQLGLPVKLPSAPANA